MDGWSRAYKFVRANPKSNSIVQEYILPDFSLNRRGHVRQADEMLEDSFQVLFMNNERFTVPEILFRPDDIGEHIFGLSKLYAHLPCRAWPDGPCSDRRA